MITLQYRHVFCTFLLNNVTDCVSRTHDPFCYVAIAQLYHLDPFDESEMSVPDAEFASIGLHSPHL